MNPFSISSIGTTVGTMQNAMAPTSLPMILPRRSAITAKAEYQLAYEWNADAVKIGIVVGVGVATVGFLAIKAMKKKGK